MVLTFGYLDEALHMYLIEFGHYPPQELGISALLPTDTGESKEYQKGSGFLNHIPRDAWGNPFNYQYPGTRSADGFDLWTNGADGKIGGNGKNKDCGNWHPDFRDCVNSYGFVQARSGISPLYVGIPIGIAIGLPLYGVGIFVRWRENEKLLWGFHLFVFIYLVTLFPLVIALFDR